MKKCKLLFLLMFVGILGAAAQGGSGFQRRTPEDRAKMQVQRMTDSLKISDVQQKDINNVLIDFYKSVDKLREGLQPGERPNMEDIQKLTIERDAKLKIILTEQQYTKFKDMEAAMRNRQQRPPGQ